MRVLVVDDEAGLRQFLKRVIELQGHTVVEAASAGEAISIAQRGRDIAAAFCDVYLPDQNGLWLAQQLARTHPRTAVVLVTGAQELDIVVGGMRAGVVDFLLKPCAVEQVINALERAVFTHAGRCAQVNVERELNHSRAEVAAALEQLALDAAYIETVTSMLNVQAGGAGEGALR